MLSSGFHRASLRASLLHLKKNKDKIEELFNEINYLPEIIAISESNIKSTTVDNLSLTDYAFIHNDSTTNAGGVAIYIKKTN